MKEFHEGIPEADLNFIKMKHDTRDSVALRFLRARKFDVAESLKMAKDCVVRALVALHYDGLIRVVCRCGLARSAHRN